jgi:predicted Zn-dependent protease with MMP-like domain
MRRVAVPALVALVAGLSCVALMGGFSPSRPVRVLETAALAMLGGGIVGGGMLMIAFRLADWRDPESEADFERVVQRSERLARDGLAAEPWESEFLALDPLDDDDFEELVRDALDELPDLLQNALRHTPVVISDGGARRRAYGLYQGDGPLRGNHHNRIVIFRDTLRRDFGHDAELLREQVIRTVRHELAHHVGFDEMGVRGLGL